MLQQLNAFVTPSQSHLASVRAEFPHPPVLFFFVLVVVVVKRSNDAPTVPQSCVFFG